MLVSTIEAAASVKQRTSQPPTGKLKVSNIFAQGINGYIPRYMEIEGITIYTPRAIVGGAVFETGSSQKYSVMTDLNVILFTNFIGHTYTTSDRKFINAGDASDVLTAFDIPLNNNGRNKITYHLSKCDAQIVWDVSNASTATGHQTSNPILLEAFLVNNTPSRQAHDVTFDCRVTVWGYYDKVKSDRPLSVIWK